ncbi:MAG: Ig-like domain-containing protein, partial [Gemmatimonadales bacterium]
GLWMIAAGDTTTVGLGVYASGGSISPPTWAPDGSKIAFSHSVSGLGNEVLTVTRDGSTADTLSQSIYSDFSPSWSPDGTQIAFVSTRVSPQSIYLMDVDGGNQTRLTTTHTIFEIAWSPSGSHIAFTGYVCCSRRLWTYSLDSATATEVFTSSNLRNPGYPAWSPAGDKIVFHDLSAQRIDTVAAFVPSTATPGTPTPLFEWQEHPQWLTVGQAFISRVISTFRDLILHRASDGRHLRMTRNPAGQPRHPVFRAESPVYVDTVTVSPATATISVGGQPDPTTVQLTAAVKDNSGSPIVPRSGVRWISSDPAVATVDQNGLVTAVAQGTVTITATAGGWRSGTASVTVNP